MSLFTKSYLKLRFINNIMEKQILDIVQLIDKNPITKLSQTYQNKLLQKLQENFTNTQQHIFVSSFFLLFKLQQK